MMMQMLMARTPSASNVADAQNWAASNTGTRASYQLNTNGGYTQDGTGAAGDWYTPTATGIGSSYWVLATILSGPSLFSGTIGTRQQLSSDGKWECQLGAETELSLEIWDAASGGNLKGTNYLALASL